MPKANKRIQQDSPNSIFKICKALSFKPFEKWEYCQQSQALSPSPTYSIGMKISAHHELERKQLQ
jgi:hypothetical protein